MFLFTKLNHLTSIIRLRAYLYLASSPTHNLLYLNLQNHQFSSSLLSSSSVKASLKQREFTVDYLIKKCGFTPRRALSASKCMHFKGTDNPDSVLAFFKDHAFTQTQTSKVVNYLPHLLACNPEKTLLPKLEFLKFKGYSDSDIVVIISRWPQILSRSLENQLIPSFNFFNDMLRSDSRKKKAAFKSCFGVLLFDLEKHGSANVDILNKIGVPKKNIGYLLTNQPRVLMTSCENFRKTVDEVMEIGFCPSNIKFIIAVHALRSMSKSTWDKKVEVYKKWGWSEDDLFAAFRRYPWCMTNSEVKINLVMEYWVNKMGWKSSLLVNSPKVISFSLEKRIKPRYNVYHFLVSNGLLDPVYMNFVWMLNCTENSFFERFVEPYKEEANDLLKLYKQKLDLTK